MRGPLQIAKQYILSDGDLSFRRGEGKSNKNGGAEQGVLGIR